MSCGKASFTADLRPSKKNQFYKSCNTYVDRAKAGREEFAPLQVTLSTIETAMLLLNSEEVPVLLKVFNHLTEFVRLRTENVELIKEKGMLELLLQKEFFIEHEHPIVKRFALYLADAMIETINTLVELETDKVREIMDLCQRYYLKESDDFCFEYLSVIISKCMDDPMVACSFPNDAEFLAKFFENTSNTDNPDLMFHSVEAISKMLQVLSTEQIQDITAAENFPIDRVLCELAGNYAETRSAALRLVKILILDTSPTSPFNKAGRALFVLSQLTKVFCDDTKNENAADIVDVLATAMRTEKMTKIFFDHLLFNKIVQNMDEHVQDYALETRCKIILIFAEAAQYTQFLARLHGAEITHLFLNCLLENTPAPSAHVLIGLNRMMKLQAAANVILDNYDKGILPKLLGITLDLEIDIKTREQASELLINLLVFAFHPTAELLMELNLPESLAAIFSQGLPQLSIDLILNLLNLIENLAQDELHREALGQTSIFVRSLGELLQTTFSAATLTANIFRCACTLVDVEAFRKDLLGCYLPASIKRGLTSLSNSVKSAVTNFILQTTRFPDYVQEYIDQSVLEVLVKNPKNAFCVPTWTPAIDSILSKCPSLKFAIRHHLSFMDSTVGADFFVSKKHFEDFRIFQDILKEEVSPLHPVLVVNFNRPTTPEDMVVAVPPDCLTPDDGNPDEWCYCRLPGDDRLPEYLNELNVLLAQNDLIENQPKRQRAVDFDNLAKRAKIIAQIVARSLNNGLETLDLTNNLDCSTHAVKCHMRDLSRFLHCNFIPLGIVRTGCQFERAILFKALADQIGMPCTLQRSVDGGLLFNEVPLPVENEQDVHCQKQTMKFMPWRMLRPTHVVDLIYTVGELYPINSRQALQYLRLC